MRGDVSFVFDVLHTYLHTYLSEATDSQQRIGDARRARALGDLGAVHLLEGHLLLALRAGAPPAVQLPRVHAARPRLSPWAVAERAPASLDAHTLFSLMLLSLCSLTLKWGAADDESQS